MAQYKIGFIGCGNMGSAMLKGILASGLASKNDVIVSVHTEATAKRIEESFGVKAVTDNEFAVKEADTVILAIKPVMFDSVIPEIKDAISSEKLIISVAAGKTIKAIEDYFSKAGLRIVRAMPNTPAMVGEGMSALVAGEGVTDSDKEYALSIFESFGKAEYITENLMDAVIGVSGSSPAYVYMFIEALADGAVAEGMPRDKAYKFASQSVLGSAKMVLETGEHPGKLKDAVCSPGGTTIEAVAVLEEQGLRQAVIAGERAAAKKSRDMSK